MGTRQVSIRADEGLFLGLAKQNMLFHQCIFELCDNAIAAAVSYTHLTLPTTERV